MLPTLKIPYSHKNNSGRAMATARRLKNNPMDATCRALFRLDHRAGAGDGDGDTAANWEGVAMRTCDGWY